MYLGDVGGTLSAISFSYSTPLQNGVNMYTQPLGTHALKATASCISVSGPECFQGFCGLAVNEHHSHQSGLLETLSFNIFALLCACSIQTIEDAEKSENCQKHAETEV